MLTSLLLSNLASPPAASPSTAVVVTNVWPQYRREGRR